jgi:hypothetical protein
MSNQLLRLFHGSDAYMLEASEELQALFVTDKADFVAFDSLLDDPFAANWKTNIDTALAFTSDNTVLGEQKDQTASVEQALKDCNDAWRNLSYFAQKAYHAHPGTLQQFGIGNKHHNAFKSQAKAVEFMDEMIAIATNHQADLLAAGCPHAVIDAITTTANNLRTLNTTQNTTIDGRPAITQTRITQLNEVYTTMLQVIEAAKFIYQTNPAKLNQYQYNPPVNHLLPANTQQFNLQPGNVLNIKFDGIIITPTTTVKITATGTTFYLYTADAPDAQPDTQYLEIKHDKTITKTAAQLDTLIGTKPYVNLHNHGTHPGTCTIVVRAEVL